MPSKKAKPKMKGVAVPKGKAPSRAKAQAERAPTREEQLAALKVESDLQMQELIERRLALPIEKRTNFLRVRLPGGGSAL